MPNNTITTFVFAGVLLFIMAAILVLGIRSDALTFDELAHIPSGYSYLTQQDYRLNSEHPPLAKDVSAIPLLFSNLNFPTQSQNWLQDAEAPPWWVQFDLGTEFLYKSGNDPLSLIFWSRLPMVLLTIALGAFLFFWTRKLFGNTWALAGLTLFAFSPSFLAHGKLVTTDVACALGIVLALYYWIEFLKQPTKWNITKAGSALALALLFKFAAVLLIPFFGVIAIIYALGNPYSTGKLRSVGKYIGLSLLVGIVALALIAPVYELHILNYPAERQVRDTAQHFTEGGITFYEEYIIVLADQPPFRGFAQFTRGILMTLQRGQFGNTVFLFGQVSYDGWWYYFPLVYLFKVPLALHILTLLGLFGILWTMQKQWYRGLKELFFHWLLKKHFLFFALALFIVSWFGIAMLGNLNIGVRHLLPTFPLLYILTLWGIRETLSYIRNTNIKRGTIAFIAGLFAWYIASSFAGFPQYIPYYNELAGGTQNGYQVTLDSNYDWGQDFYRLLDFVETNNIEKLHLDYSGGEDPGYWLGARYQELDPTAQGFTPSAVEGWIAVSVNELQQGIATPVSQEGRAAYYYTWLLEHEPVARAGTSIFIYHIQ